MDRGRSAARRSSRLASRSTNTRSVSGCMMPGIGRGGGSDDRHRDDRDRQFAPMLADIAAKEPGQEGLGGALHRGARAGLGQCILPSSLRRTLAWGGILGQTFAGLLPFVCCAFGAPLRMRARCRIGIVLTGFRTKRSSPCFQGEVRRGLGREVARWWINPLPALPLGEGEEKAVSLVAARANQATATNGASCRPGVR